jgi:hypothetical protein
VIRVYDKAGNMISGTMSDTKEWRTYEQAAQHLLEQFASYF